MSYFNCSMDPALELLCTPPAVRRGVLDSDPQETQLRAPRAPTKALTALDAVISALDASSAVGVRTNPLASSSAAPAANPAESPVAFMEMMARMLDDRIGRVTSQLGQLSLTVVENRAEFQAFVADSTALLASLMSEPLLPRVRLEAHYIVRLRRRRPRFRWHGRRHLVVCHVYRWLFRLRPCQLWW